MNSTVTSQIPNGRFLCFKTIRINTLTCSDFALFAIIQKKVGKKAAEPSNATKAAGEVYKIRNSKYTWPWKKMTVLK